MLRKRVLFISLIPFLIFSALFANSSIRLKEADKQFNSYSSKLSSTANEILKHKKEIKNLKKELFKLDRELKKEEFKYKKESVILKTLQDKQNRLLKKQRGVQSKIGVLTASIVSLEIVSSGDRGIQTLDGIILREVHKSIKKVNGNKVNRFNSDLLDRKKSIDEVTKKVNKLKENIEFIEDKKARVKSKKRQKEDITKSLKRKEIEYKSMLKSIKKEKDSLQAEINRLRKKKPQIDEAQKKEYVRQMGSSYQKSSTRKYKGSKTIPPLDGYTVLKKYGKFIDPVYKIKIFNNSVLLKPKTKGAVVRNVYNGKVSLVKSTPLLGNIVIIEHYNGMQTIYAHLDSTAPNIDVGKKIKRGTIIGRVYKDLHFEVIKKNHHIDPMTVIE